MLLYFFSLFFFFKFFFFIYFFFKLFYSFIVFLFQYQYSFIHLFFIIFFFYLLLLLSFPNHIYALECPDVNIKSPSVELPIEEPLDSVQRTKEHFDRLDSRKPSSLTSVKNTEITTTRINSSNSNMPIIIGTVLVISAVSVGCYVTYSIVSSGIGNNITNYITVFILRYLDDGNDD
jgi:hypothetical protein